MRSSVYLWNSTGRKHANITWFTSTTVAAHSCHPEMCAATSPDRMRSHRVWSAGSPVLTHVVCRPEICQIRLKNEFLQSGLSCLNVISLGRFDPHFTIKVRPAVFTHLLRYSTETIWNPVVREAGNHLTSRSVSTCCQTPERLKQKKGFVTLVSTVDSLSVLSRLPYFMWFSDVLHQLKKCAAWLNPAFLSEEPDLCR